MKKIITFFINLQEIIKDKYFLSCVDDEKLEELLEDIELKDKNNSEEIIKRLDELKKLKLENQDKTDYSIIDIYLNDGTKYIMNFIIKHLRLLFKMFLIFY